MNTSKSNKAFHDGNQTSADSSLNPIVSGSIWKAIWQMSWPLLTTYILSSCIGLTDTFLAGFVGGAAQAALGIGEQAIFLCVVIGTGLAIGTVACVARTYGAGDLALARQYARESLAVSALVGFFAAAVGVAVAGPLVPLFGADPEVSRQGIRYLQLCSLGNFPFVVATCQSAVFRAVGAPRYALSLWLLISGISIGGSFLLFFGHFPIGHMSLDAMSISWTVGSSTGVVLGFIWLRRFWRKQGLPEQEGFDLRQSITRVKELLEIGGPAVMAEIVWTTSNFLTYKVFAVMPHSAQVQAGWSIAMKIEETFATMPLLALSMAAATIVGQNLGAGREDRARISGWKISIYSTLLMVGVGIVLMVCGRNIANALSNDPLVIDYTTSLLKLAPLTVPALALWLVLFGAQEGAGCTWTPMICNSVLYLLVRLPLYWLLALPLKLGLTGILAALVLSRLLVAAVAIFVYRCGFTDLLAPAVIRRALAQRFAGGLLAKASERAGRTCLQET